MAGLGAEGDDEIIVPPTINALLEARLDRLGREERATVEPAAVVGLEFPQPAVESLAPAVLRATVPKHLASLSHKHFIQPTDSNDAEASFRFHHHLVRDTVYAGLLKRARASLHIEFVRWQDHINAESERGLEFEQILGYHLEQAHRYLSELGPLDEQGLAITSMRSGTQFQPGEKATCQGCHEVRHRAPATQAASLAMLRPPSTISNSFSLKEVQYPYQL